MVQIGSRIDGCHCCEQLRVVGEFWNVHPRFRIFLCAECLQRAAEGIRQAATKLVVPTEARACSIES